MELDKIRNIAIYMAEKIPNLYFTKFLKLLYYLDFISIQEVGSSVTNDIYFALPYGPIPTFIKDNIDLLDVSNRQNEADLLKDPSTGAEVYRDAKSFFDGYITLRKDGGTILQHSKSFNAETLSGYEKKLLDDIIEQFKEISVKDIVARTHVEAPYAQTAPNNVIDYGMAFLLNIKEILPQRTFIFDKNISLSRFNSR